MINFLSNWIEQITLSIIIVSIFELILPKSNLKKYIKVVLGIYIIFCLISPFVNSSALYDIKDIDLQNYVQDIGEKEINVNQASMNSRLQDLYIQELKKDISKKVEEDGYNVSKCDIDADLNQNDEKAGIYNINLVLSKRKIEVVEEINIGKSDDKEEVTKDTEKIREKIANYYEINEDLINIKIK